MSKSEDFINVIYGVTDQQKFKQEQHDDNTLDACFNRQQCQNDNETTKFVTIAGLLFRERRSDKKGVSRQLVIPKIHRLDIMKLAHDGQLPEHYGFLRTKIRVQDLYYWPQMYAEIHKYVKSCQVCKQLCKNGQSEVVKHLHQNNSCYDLNSYNNFHVKSEDNYNISSKGLDNENILDNHIYHINICKYTNQGVLNKVLYDENGNILHNIHDVSDFNSVCKRCEALRPP